MAATNIRKEDGLWHVDVGADTYAAPVLVNAAGAWAGRIAASLGEPVPVETVAPMLMITSRVPHFIDPVVILRGRKLSFKQFANGTVLIGGGHLATPDQDRNETVLDWRSLADQRAHGVRTVPGDAQRDHRAGLGRHRGQDETMICRCSVRAPATPGSITSSAFRCMASSSAPAPAP